MPLHTTAIRIAPARGSEPVVWPHDPTHGSSNPKIPELPLAGTGLSLMSSARLDPDIGFWNMSMVRIAQVIRMPFLFVPFSAVYYVGVPPDRSNEASAIINLMPTWAAASCVVHHDDADSADAGPPCAAGKTGHGL